MIIILRIKCQNDEKTKKDSFRNSMCSDVGNAHNIWFIISGDTGFSRFNYN